MTFDEELTKLIEDARSAGLSQAEIEAAVAECYQRNGRAVPAPITGTVTITEPNDRFGRR